MDLQEKMLTVLGLSESESLAITDIQKAYKELCFVWHPDRFPDNMRGRAEDKLKEINAAYDWLKKNFENTDQKATITVSPNMDRPAETVSYGEDEEPSSPQIDISPLFKLLSTISVLAGFFFGFYALVCVFQYFFGGAIDTPGVDFITYAPLTLFLFWVASALDDRAR